MIKPINETIKTKGLLNMSIFNDFLKTKNIGINIKSRFLFAYYFDSNILLK